MTRRTVTRGWPLRALVLSIGVAAAGYLGVAFWSGWHDVTAAFGQIGLAGTGAALGLSLVNYGLRFVRWQRYLKQLGHAVTWPASLRIYLGGFALTTTPGKAGEAFRGVLLKPHGVPYPATFAAFISERLSDLLAVLMLTLFGLAQYPQAHGLVLAGAASLLLALGCLTSKALPAALYRFAARRRGRLMTLLSHASDVLLRARRCHQPAMLAQATLLGLVAWGAEALAFHWVLGWLGADVSLGLACFIYALAMLAGALSFLPGGLGSAEAVMVSLLTVAGMPPAAAVAATVFTRLATLWFAVAIGLGCLMGSRLEKRLTEPAS
ncbi:lysylphosphatidylglycerol synthase transmembrane domain-containing protein [Halomonas piscis]|uniref:Lysylphosphatidylglycerol synthase transmembrane domain-containing protein n=1 Tax=Halomonas piscis TaxID=3031727 RepID=A0ABY9Z267_9GAMM|nr:lysylphosphatidylglycerol synthase transmembrane domain-containing protein [Halomonas piscis]WNK21227.1 lysylphosphatidylglycerol synthase transmembrane domain-containing protein [Halomonas piscis]